MNWFSVFYSIDSSVKVINKLCSEMPGHFAEVMSKQRFTLKIIIFFEQTPLKYPQYIQLQGPPTSLSHIYIAQDSNSWPSAYSTPNCSTACLGSSAAVWKSITYWDIDHSRVVDAVRINNNIVRCINIILNNYLYLQHEKQTKQYEEFLTSVQVRGKQLLKHKLTMKCLWGGV